MPDHADPTSDASERLITRRHLLAGTGAIGIAIAVTPRVLGHDDDDHDDDNSGHGSGHEDDHSGDDSGGSGSSDDDGKVQASGTAPAGSVEVRIVDDDQDAFQPGTVTIDAGQTVTWVNLDDDAHTATSGDFDTDSIAPGDLVTITFDEPGSFPYSCRFHPEMTGTVEVRDASGNVPGRVGASPAASPQASPGATSGESAAVTIDNIAFEPSRLEVSVGTTVTWTNAEPVPHTATSSDGTFSSETMDQGDTFSHTFDTAGTFDYSCAVHPNMQGTVVVTA
jgi:plastocyanin